ncbi:hypothetical protein F4779DRAFT_618601 [Xylariaceae sp. FL0662B]|nr:hypothetical protein F4779DRAFT_618601 [Xylariaceae sp. FL0662B]
MTFPQFSHLPTELRLQIWEEALCLETTKRLVVVSADSLRILPTKHNLSPFLTVNHESREQAKAFYTFTVDVYHYATPPEAQDQAPTEQLGGDEEPHDNFSLDNDDNDGNDDDSSSSPSHSDFGESDEEEPWTQDTLGPPAGKLYLSITRDIFMVGLPWYPDQRERRLLAAEAPFRRIPCTYLTAPIADGDAARVQRLFKHTYEPPADCDSWLNMSEEQERAQSRLGTLFAGAPYTCYIFYHFSEGDPPRFDLDQVLARGGEGAFRYFGARVKYSRNWWPNMVDKTKGLWPWLKRLDDEHYNSEGEHEIVQGVEINDSFT